MKRNNILSIGQSCVGCRSCEQSCAFGCIRMIPDKEGFLYPAVDDSRCTDCGACLRSCPISHAAALHPARSAYALRNRNREELMESTSGGAADLAAGLVIGQGGVAFGAVYDRDMRVRHIAVTSQAERGRLRSSKYVQSDTEACYSEAKKYLSQGVEVLFTGTPCQIAGLYAFLGRDYDNLYTIDLICHGVPSPLLFEKQIAYLQKRMRGNIQCYNFRPKDICWGAYDPKIKTGKGSRILFFDKYQGHFGAGDCLRECCYSCRYARTDRVGDLTVGDFWGVRECHPELYTESGVSAVFANTEKGQRLVNQLEVRSYMTEVRPDEIIQNNPHLRKPVERPDSRDSFYRGIDGKRYMETLSWAGGRRRLWKGLLKAVLPVWAIKWLRKLKT